MAELALVAALLFLGALVRSFLGFGDAAVAMPLLTLAAVPIEVSVPLVGLAGFLVAVLALRRGQAFDRTALSRLTVGTVVGVPTGVLLVTRASERLLAVVLGVLLLAYGVTMLARPRLRRRGVPSWWSYPFGFAAGSLGSAYNFNGVPVAVFGTLRGWAPEQFRSTLQAHFVISSLLVVAGHGAGGLWTWEVARSFLAAVPGLVLAVPLGRTLHHRVSPAVFTHVVYLVIALLGGVLLLT